MTIDLHHVIDYISYWIMFWTIVNIFLPPREVFADDKGNIPRWYNITLKLVAFYGAMNLRQVTVKLYSAVQNAEPPIQRNLEVAAKSTEEAAQAIEAAKAAVPPKD